MSLNVKTFAPTADGYDLLRRRLLEGGEALTTQVEREVSEHWPVADVHALREELLELSAAKADGIARATRGQRESGAGGAPPGNGAIGAGPQSLRFTPIIKNPAAMKAEEAKAYAALNAIMVERYPDFAVFLADPDAFVDEMQTRYERQKVLTPDHPLDFPYSEVGVPRLKEMLPALERKTKELDEQLASTQKDMRSAPQWRVHRYAAKLDDLTVAAQFLKEVTTEVKQRTSPGGDVTCLRLYQLTKSIPAALGYDGDTALSRYSRGWLKVDDKLQGHKDTPIREAYKAFQTKSYAIFDAPAAAISGFREVEGRFVDSVFDKQRMDMLGIPADHELDMDILMRLLRPFGTRSNAQATLMMLGVTGTAIAADGFVRPPPQFLVHDLRHSTSIYTKRKLYDEQHGLDPEASMKLSRRTDVWALDLLKAYEAIKDPQLQQAVKLLVFNNHHDRGLVLAPSSYKGKKSGITVRLLYKMLTISGQKTGFNHHRQRLHEAHQWMCDFFAPRAQEEQALWTKR